MDCFIKYKMHYIFSVQIVYFQFDRHLQLWPSMPLLSSSAMALYASAASGGIAIPSPKHIDKFPGLEMAIPGNHTFLPSYPSNALMLSTGPTTNLVDPSSKHSKLYNSSCLELCWSFIERLSLVKSIHSFSGFGYHYRKIKNLITKYQLKSMLTMEGAKFLI